LRKPYLLQGDLNQDGHINVLDIVLIVDIIVGDNPDPTTYELAAADLNNDGAVDVLDVIRLQQLITNYNLSRIFYSGIPIDINLKSTTSSLNRSNSEEIEIFIDTEDLIAGLQMDIEFVNNLWIFDTLTTTGFTENMITRFNEIDEGVVRFVVYSDQPEAFGPGDGTVAILHFDETVLGRDVIQISDLSCVNVKIGGMDGIPLPYNVAEQEATISLPTKYALSQNYPNPFNTSTTINYDIPVFVSDDFENQHVSLIIYNSLGQQVKELVNTYRAPSSYHVIWNGKNDNGNYVSTGIYVYKVKTDDFMSVKKMTLVK